jgi:hypothetical protein
MMAKVSEVGSFATWEAPLEFLCRGIKVVMDNPNVGEIWELVLQN